MKKLFSLLVAMVITTMAFGQNDNILYPIDQPVQDTQDRTGWIGGTETYDYYFVLEEGDKYGMRLPAAGALPAGELSVTKVSFAWQSTGGNNTFDPNLCIHIYAGGNGDWIQEGQNVSKTMDTTVQGTLLYSQTYYCPSNGWQVVELSRPVALPADQEIWIVMEALGRSCCWVCPDMDKQHPEWWGQHVLYNYIEPAEPTPEEPAGYYWRTAAFRNPNTDARVPGKFALKVLIDNGEPYVKTNDWVVNMYSLETMEDQENITYLYVDPYMMQDSLYLAPALWNMGPDTNDSDGRIKMWIEGTEYVFIDTNLSVRVTDIVVESGHGWIFKTLGGLLAFSDMEDLGLTFPFNVCFSFEPFGLDPVLSNNQACVEITDVEPEDPDDGISETSNTLTVSPNPASTYIKVENAAGSRIAVYNIAGQEVLSIISAEANETLNVSNLTAGLYIVRVVDGNEVSTAKVNIVR